MIKCFTWTASNNNSIELYIGKIIIMCFQTLKTLIEIPYRSLSNEEDGLLDGINSISFHLGTDEKIINSIKYTLKCECKLMYLYYND
jgi:hypothetical protein